MLSWLVSNDHFAFALNPDSRSAGERLVRRVDDARRSEDLHAVRVGVALVRLHGEGRIGLAILLVRADHMLVDVDDRLHQNSLSVNITAPSF